jgi:hypothetical protein
MKKLADVLILLATLAGLSGAASDANAANRFAVANGAWNQTGPTIWATVSGGAAGASVPVAGDAVFIGDTATVRTVTIPAGYAAAATSVTIGNATAVAGGSSLTLSAANSSLTTSAGITINRPSNSTTNLLSIGAGTVTVGGTVTLAGTNTTTTRVNRINITTGTLDIAGDLVFITGSTAGNLIDMSGGAGTINLAGAFTAAAGTLTPGATSKFNYDGSVAQTVRIGTSSIVYNNLHLNNSNAAGATLSAAISATNVLGNVRIQSGILNNGGFAIVGSAADTFEIASGARFNLTGTSGMPSAYGTYTLAADSTTSFQGGNQTIAAVSVTSAVAITYGHVIAQGGSTKTAGAATPPAALSIAGNLSIETGTTFTATTNDPIINVTGNMAINGTGVYTASNINTRPLTVGGDFTVGGTYTGNVAPLNVGGDFTRTGTFTSSTGLVTLNGSTATTQTVTGATTITNLQINNTGSPGGVTLASNVTVGTLLTLTSGVVTTGGNTLITSANCPGSISRTGGHVAGFLQLQVPAGISTCIHHVGDSTTYRPISLTFPATTTAGNLTGSVSLGAGDHGNIATSDLDPGQSVNRFWTLTNGGVGLGAGTYSVTFTFVAGDVDTNADPLTFEVARWTGAAWAATTAGTRTATTTQATGLNSFSDFAVGQRRLNNFLIGGIPGGRVCNPQTLSITARNSSNQTLTNYRGLVNLSTSTSHGDWSIVLAGGTLNNGTADDGAATYQFLAGDLGVASLRLTNTHPETLTVSVNDAAAAVTSTSSSYQVDIYVFAITNDTIQVAGRNQAMSVQLNCNTVDTGYAGSKNLKAWVTLDTDDPGGTRPSINAVTLPGSTPGANNIALTFASGVATFNLATVDVGKYVLKLRDDSRAYSTGSDIDGTSSTITTRPFALVVRDITQGATINQGGTATSGNKFITAADTFQATVGAYLWNSAADTSPADGVPDAGATLAQITNNGTGGAPSYRWTTTLSAASPFTPGTGSLATLSNGAQTGACPTGTPNCFTNGIATPTNLSYPEVGSFTLAATATNFLNSGINLTAIVFDNSATPARNAVIGRFYPDHFTLTASALAPACAGGGFTYMGHAGLGYTIGIDARNKGDLNTGCGTSGKALCNYINNPTYNTGAVSLPAENANNGTDLNPIGTPRLTPLTGSWAAGAYSFSTTTATFSRPASPDGPFDSLQIGVRVTDADGPVIQGLDMNAATTGDCTSGSTCTAKSIGTTIVRFGRLTIGNASGSAALPLLVPIEAQYWNGKSFVTNTLDACTSVSASVAGSDVAMGSYSTALAPPPCKTAISNGGALTSGRRSLRLSAPTGNASGNLTLTVNLGAVASGNTCTTAGAAQGTATTANLPHLQSGSGFNQNPSGRATFGVYKGSEDQIFRQENF